MILGFLEDINSLYLTNCNKIISLSKIGIKINMNLTLCNKSTIFKVPFNDLILITNLEMLPFTRVNLSYEPMASKTTSVMSLTFNLILFFLA
jgi:hypothetical protein